MFTQRARTTTLAALLLAVLPPQRAAAQEALTPEGREHAAAWGAHHLCAGLWVVGRDHRRDTETVIARDIAPFPWFYWEESFDFDVDEKAYRVAVRAPGTPVRAVGVAGSGNAALAHGRSR
jgi:hypothetical protein